MFTKNNILLTLTLLIAAVVVPFLGTAQELRLPDNEKGESRRGIGVDFRINSIVIDPQYRNNASALRQIDSLYNALSQDTTIKIVAVEFCGTASPEGPADLNNYLAHERLKALEKLVRQRINLPDGIVVENDHFIAWNYLAVLVEGDATIQNKEKILEILHSELPMTKDYKGRRIDGRITALQKIDGGRTWAMLQKRYFGKLRNALFILVTTSSVVPEEVVEETPVEEEVIETPAEPEMEQEPETKEFTEEEEPEQRLISEPAQEAQQAEGKTKRARGKKVEGDSEISLGGVDGMQGGSITSTAVAGAKDNRTPLMNVKINSVEAAALIANVGAEFRVLPNLSIDVMGHYSPYNYFKFDRKIRVFAIQPEVRYWFGDALVKGHFVGLHVPVSGFNVQLGENRFQDPNRAAWGIGLSYGYAMPLGKNTNWGVEFTIGLGYMNIVYDVYEGVRNGKYLRTNKMNYWGPTRLGVDFSYRINYKKNNKVKTLGE